MLMNDLTATQTQHFVNLGAGRMILPADKPAHHALVDDNVYDRSHVWTNVDWKDSDGIDVVHNLFDHQWPFEDNTFDGALLSHIVEHIPHVTDSDLPDGFYAFFAELWRVLKPGAQAHILCPYGRSDGALMDPTHTRYILPQTFSYLTPNPDAPFTMNYGSAWRMVNVRYQLAPSVVGLPQSVIEHLAHHSHNIISDLYVCLEVIKDEN